MPDARLILGDCLTVLPTLPADSFDAVVTDPPYGLEFMGKDWDAPWKYGIKGFGFTDAKGRNPAPVFGSTRNPMCRRCHRHKRGSKNHVACACSEPDFDDQAHRAADMARYQAWCQAWAAECLRVLKPGGRLLAFGGTRTHHRLWSAVEDAGFVVEDTLAWLYGQGFPKHRSKLKPAWEPIVLAWKPARYATPLQVDACRVACEERPLREKRPNGIAGHSLRGSLDASLNGSKAIGTTAAGRWPANVVLDEAAAALLDEQSGECSSRPAKNGLKGKAGAPKFTDTYQVYAEQGDRYGGYQGDTGGASRFFYCPKATRADRGPGNTHPTVKPHNLMRWLCRLITPPGGLVLDPFAGSGSTGKACVAEGFGFVGVEQRPDYLAIAERRLAAARADVEPEPEDLPLFAPPAV